MQNRQFNFTLNFFVHCNIGNIKQHEIGLRNSFYLIIWNAPFRAICFVTFYSRNFNLPNSKVQIASRTLMLATNLSTANHICASNNLALYGSLSITTSYARMWFQKAIITDFLVNHFWIVLLVILFLTLIALLHLTFIDDLSAFFANCALR